MEKSIKRRNEELEKQMDRLNGLASRVGRRNIFSETSATYRGGCFYLVAWTGQPAALASFNDPRELEEVLLRLSAVASVTADEFLKAKGRLWAEQLAFSEKRRELVAVARRLDFPDAALQQQKTMEQAWAMRARERLCSKARDWLDIYAILPEHVGISDFEKHDPDAENPEDPVPCVDFDWLSGEYRCHYIRNFSVVYQRASSGPDQNFMAELRRYHTKNIWHTWEMLVDGQILPLMNEIKEAGAYTARGQEIITQIKDIVGPWSIPHPWPHKDTERKRLRRVKVRQHIQRLPALISNTQKDQTATLI